MNWFVFVLLGDRLGLLVQVNDAREVVRQENEVAILTDRLQRLEVTLDQRSLGERVGIQKVVRVGLSLRGLDQLLGSDLLSLQVRFRSLNSDLRLLSRRVRVLDGLRGAGAADAHVVHDETDLVPLVLQPLGDVGAKRVVLSQQIERVEGPSRYPNHRPDVVEHPLCAERVFVSVGSEDVDGLAGVQRVLHLDVDLIGNALGVHDGHRASGLLLFAVGKDHLLIEDVERSGVDEGRLPVPARLSRRSDDVASPVLLDDDLTTVLRVRDGREHERDRDSDQTQASPAKGVLRPDRRVTVVVRGVGECAPETQRSNQSNDSQNNRYDNHWFFSLNARYCLKVVF